MNMRSVDTSYFMVSAIYQAKYAIFLLDTAQQEFGTAFNSKHFKDFSLIDGKQY